LAGIKVVAPTGADPAEALRLLERPSYLARALPFARSYMGGRLLVELEAFLCSVRDRCTLVAAKRGPRSLEVRLSGARSSMTIRFTAEQDGIWVQTWYTGPYSWRISRAVLRAAADAAWSALRDARRSREARRREDTLGSPGRYRDMLESMRLVETLEASVERGGLPSLVMDTVEGIPGLVLVEGEWPLGELACLAREGVILDGLVIRGEERLRGPESLLLVEGKTSLRIYAEETHRK